MSNVNQLILKISNVVGFALVLVVCYAYPHHKDENEHRDKILIYPALWVFKIWLPIFGLLAGFLVYQFFEAANSATVEGIKWYYIATSLLSISFVVTKHHGSLDILELIIHLLLLGFLSKIYSNLSYYPSKNIFDRLFVHYSFTMYTAWLVFATALELWIVFPALNTTLLSILAIALIGVTGLHFVDYHDRRDVVFSGTLAWVLVGIALNDHDEVEQKPIVFAASVASGLIIGGILRTFIHQGLALWRLRRQRTLDETSPLLG